MSHTKRKRNALMVALHRKGYSYAEIADECGITRQRAYTVVRREMERGNMDWQSAEEQADREVSIGREETEAFDAIQSLFFFYEEERKKYIDGVGTLRELRRMRARIALAALALVQEEKLA
jgi:predicted transcriptional regulator